MEVNEVTIISTPR